MKPWIENPWLVDATSHHEAGHAVVAEFLGLPLSYVYSGGGGPHLRYADLGDPDRATLERAAMVSLVGGVAEHRAETDNLRWNYWRPTSASFEAAGARTDRDAVRTLCLELAAGDEAGARVKEQELRGRLLDLMEDPAFWPSVEVVAWAFRSERVLLPTEIEAMVAAVRDELRAPVSLKGYRLSKLKQRSRALVERLAAYQALLAPPRARPDLQLVKGR